jgi:hypothetical protein
MSLGVGPVLVFASVAASPAAALYHSMPTPTENPEELEKEVLRL